MSSTSDQETAPAGEVVIVGGGIAGLYCARELARQGHQVVVLEAKQRFGGRIETGELSPPPFAGGPAHKAEFGPMRFELELQELLAALLVEYGIKTEPFSPPRAPEPPVEYPLASDERHADGTPLSSLQLLKLGIYRLFGQETFIARDEEAEVVVELSARGRKWLAALSDADGTLDDLRQTALMPGTSKLLREFGFWNALYSQLSPMAVAKILQAGPFYHLMPDNPNAVEWAIFWLRLFQLGDDTLSTIPGGVQSLSDELTTRLDEAGVRLKPGHKVIAVRPAAGERVELETEDGSIFEADHAVLALPKLPLLELAAPFPKLIHDDLEAVIAFTLLKVFCVTETPPWWQIEFPGPQVGAWNAPTRELHYLPAKPDKTKLADWRPPEQTLVLLYTDHPATAYWQPYLVDPETHAEAEVERNDELKLALAGVLFNLHWEWAIQASGLEARSGRNALSAPNRRQIGQGLELVFKAWFGDLDPGDPAWELVASEHPALIGHAARILFRAQEVYEWQLGAIGEYAIRDWSRPPFGAGCHAWAPGAQSWAVRERLAAFEFDGQKRKNLHICGEAYSDYQGFIEGALRSATDAVATIVSGGAGATGAERADDDD